MTPVEFAIQFCSIPFLCGNGLDQICLRSLRQVLEYRVFDFENYQFQLRRLRVDSSFIVAHNSRPYLVLCEFLVK